MHPDKCELIIFAPRKKLNALKDFKLNYGEIEIRNKQETKYLGLKIDQCLKAESTVDSIVKKVNGSVKFWYRNKQFFNFELRKKITKTLVQSHFDYASPAWFYGISTKSLNKLQVSLNKVCRFVLGFGPRTHIGQKELEMSGFLSISDRVEQLTLGQMFNIQKGIAPAYFDSDFVPLSHRYITRATTSKNFKISKCWGLKEKTFYCNGIKLWNALPKNLKLIENPSFFKKEMKKHILERSKKREACEYVSY